MIAFRRLFAKQQDGVASFAIVTYKKKPYAYHSNSAGKHYTEYVKRLWIDCWLFVLHFEWLTQPIEDRDE